MRSSKTPLSFDDDTEMKFFRSLSHSVVSLSKSFLINKTRLPNARGRRQHKENLSRSRGTLFRFRFCSRNARRECFSTRENFRALFNDDLLFFLGQKQPVLVEKDSRVEGFCFRYIRMNVVTSFSLSLWKESESEEEHS